MSRYQVWNKTWTFIKYKYGMQLLTEANLFDFINRQFIAIANQLLKV